MVRPNNWQIWNSIRSDATNPYQDRVPDVTKATIQVELDNLMRYEPDRNGFISGLVNKIGMSYVRSQQWENPLRAFKKGDLPYGSTVEELQLGLAQAYTYNTERTDLEKMLFGREYLESQSSYHKINRKEFYKVTVNDVELRRAFYTDYGLDDLVRRIMDVPRTSDNLDEFIQMSALFKEFDDRGGFFIQQVPSLSRDSTKDAAVQFLKIAREYAETLPFISRHYNAAGTPVFATPDKLHLFCTPAVAAALDVDALAALFNVDRAEVPFKRTIVPPEYLRIKDAQAILTTEDFFQVWDTFYGTREQQNAVNLETNYFLYHQEIISMSRFVPAILFSDTRPTTPINEDETPVTGVAPLIVKDLSGNTVNAVTRGNRYLVEGSAVTTPDGGTNTAVVLDLTGTRDGTAVDLSAYTFVRQEGHLFVSIDEHASTLTLRATSEDDAEFSATKVLNVTGEEFRVWPNPGPVEGVAAATAKIAAATTEDEPKS